MIEPDPASAPMRAYGFVLREGTDLEISGGEISLDVEAPTASLFLVRQSDEAFEPLPGVELGPEGLAARIRVEDSILRSGGELIDVAPGRKAEVELAKHAGLHSRKFAPRPRSRPRACPSPIQLVLRQVTAVSAGGLVALDSSAGRDELPITEIKARDSILSAARSETPLIQVNGQEPIDSVRDPIRWEGHSVAYHFIKTYRRDSSNRAGGSRPRRTLSPSGKTPSANARTTRSTATSSSSANGTRTRRFEPYPSRMQDSHEKAPPRASESISVDSPGQVPESRSTREQRDNRRLGYRSIASSVSRAAPSPRSSRSRAIRSRSSCDFKIGTPDPGALGVPGSSRAPINRTSSGTPQPVTAETAIIPAARCDPRRAASPPCLRRRSPPDPRPRVRPVFVPSVASGQKQRLSNPRIPRRP